MSDRKSMCLGAAVAAGLAVCAGAFPASAASHSDVINGATCIPYPPYQTSNAIPYQHWLYGFSQIAFCHLTIASEWPVTQLSYVLFTGSVSSGVLTARLCIHSGDFAVSCGAPRTIVPGGSVNWVAPPSPLPAYAAGAYVQFNFQSGAVSTVRELIPYYYH